MVLITFSYTNFFSYILNSGAHNWRSPSNWWTLSVGNTRKFWWRKLLHCTHTYSEMDIYVCIYLVVCSLFGMKCMWLDSIDQQQLDISTIRLIIGYFNRLYRAESNAVIILFESTWGIKLKVFDYMLPRCSSF